MLGGLKTNRCEVCIYNLGFQFVRFSLKTQWQWFVTLLHLIIIEKVQKQQNLFETKGTNLTKNQIST